MAFLQHDTTFSLLALAAAGVTAVFWLLRLAFTPRRTPLDGWLVLFLFTAVFAWLIAPNGHWATAKLAVLLVGTFWFYLAAALSQQRVVHAVAWLSVSMAVFALYFLLTQDWQSWPADGALLQALTARWMAIRPANSLPAMHANKTGGLLATFLPLAGVLSWQWMWQRRWLQGGGMGIVVACMSWGLLFSSSRGAWLALFCGAFLAALAIWLLAQGVKRPYVWVGTLITLVVLGPALLFTAGQLGGGLSRLILAQQTLSLIGEYPLSGGGLVAFGPLYSQYLRVIPVFFFSYAHNLYLDIWLEQGPLALLAFLGLMLTTLHLLLRADRAHGALRFGLLAGLLTLLLHGWVDDAFYGTWGAPHLLLLAGLAVALAPATLTTTCPPARNGRVPYWLVAGGMVLVTVATAVFFYRPLLSAAYANWGALQMGRVELADWPTNRWDDGTLARQVDTTPFTRALAYNAHNSSALYRLGLVALGKQEFETAVACLAAAHTHNPTHRGIRKALAYSYIWLGQIETAVPLLQGIAEAPGEMTNYVSWWRAQGRNDLAQHAERAAQALAPWRIQGTKS